MLSILFRSPVLALASGLVFLGSMSSDAALIGRWEFDGGAATQLNDTSGNGNDAVQTGTGNFIASTAFPGSGDSYQSPSGGSSRLTASLTMPLGAAERTIVMWINPDTQGDRKFIGYGSGSGGQVFNFTAEGNGVRQRHGGGNVTYGSISLNTWTHVAMRVNPGATTTGDVDVFINGVQASVTGTGGGGTGVTLNTGPSTLLQMGNSHSTNNSFDGEIDDVQFYDTALSDADILSLFNNPGTAIPEPSTFGLIGLCGFGLLLRRRR